MGRSKNNKNTTTGIGQVRKETREERRKRILAEAEARERCFRILPQTGAVIVLLIITFCIWVRSVPKSTPTLLQQQQQQQQQQQHNQQQAPLQQQQPPPFMQQQEPDIHSSNTSGDSDEKSNSPKIAPTKVSNRDEGDDVTIEL